MISIIPRGMRWAVVLTQFSVLLFATLVAGLWWGVDVSGALLYGGGVAMVNLLWLQWRMVRAATRDTSEGLSRNLQQGGRKILFELYQTALERFVLVAGLLFFGMVRLELDALALLSGFVVGQLVLILAARRLSSGGA